MSDAEARAPTRPASDALRTAILALGLLGALVFGTAFVVSYVSPLTIERAAREFVRMEVEQRVGARVDALTDSKMADLARKALGNTDAEYDKLKRDLRDGVPRRVANAVADLMNADCECRRRLVRAREAEATAKLGTLAALRERLVDVIEATYATVRDRLLREWRIFAGTNAVVFALLAGLAAARRWRGRELALPAIALVAAAVVTGGLYLFNQDWLRAILVGDTVGFAYVAYFGLALAFFGDLLLNRARVTKRLLASIGPGDIVPC